MAGRGKKHTEAVRRLYGYRAVLVHLPRGLRSLRTEIVQSTCGFRAETAPRWCVDRRAVLSVESPLYKEKLCIQHKGCNDRLPFSYLPQLHIEALSRGGGGGGGYGGWGWYHRNHQILLMSQALKENRRMMKNCSISPIYIPI